MAHNNRPAVKGRMFLDSLSAEELDGVIDRAARRASAVVSEFAVCATEAGNAIKAAIRFFIPPASLTQFTGEFDDQLMRLSFGYAAARHRGEMLPPIIDLMRVEAKYHAGDSPDAPLFI